MDTQSLPIVRTGRAGTHYRATEGSEIATAEAAKTAPK